MISDFWTPLYVIILTYTPLGTSSRMNYSFIWQSLHSEYSELCHNVGHVTLFNTLLSAPFNECFPFSMFSIILSHGGISWKVWIKYICTNFKLTIPVTMRALYSSESVQGAKSWIHTNWLLSYRNIQKRRTMNGQMCLLLLNKSVPYRIPLAGWTLSNSHHC